LVKRVWSIQYLRALAALCVVVFHALESSPYRLRVGAAGVDVFFIISGFIMATLMLGAEADPKRFLSRRINRIVPLYWCVTLITLAVGWIKPAFFYRFDGTLQNAVLSLLFLPHGGTVGAAPVAPLGWTLEYEMFFYALCVLALLAPVAHRLKLLGVFLLALVALGFALPQSNDFVRVYTNPLLLEFGAGLVLAVLWRSNLLPPTWPAALGLCAGFFGFAAEQVGWMPQSGIRVFDWGLPALLVVAGALGLESAGKVSHWRFGLLLGDASYSLYLTHGFVVSAVAWELSAAPLWLRAGLILASACLLGVASYTFFERPMTRLLNARSPALKAVSEASS
jgi:exopolysaccharide production protein ExoZ